MSRESIIQTLTNAQVLTVANIALLQNQVSDVAFMQELIAIYEGKVKNYFSACKRNVVNAVAKKNLCPAEYSQTMATEVISDFMYGLNLKSIKTSLLSSLILLLKEISPELLISLGMASLYKDANNIVHYHNFTDQINSVSIKYFARYRLCRDLASTDLQQLCHQVQSIAPDLFPNYLLQSLIQQNAIENSLAGAVAAKITAEADLEQLWANEFSNGVRDFPELFNSCLFGQILYLSSVLQTTALSLQDKELFFAHMDNPTTNAQFITQICQGYVHAMKSVEMVTKIYTANKQVGEFDKICIAPVPLLGIKIVVQDVIAARKTLITQSLSTIQMAKDNINSQVLLTNQQNQATASQHAATITSDLGSLDSRINKSREDAIAKVNHAREEFTANVTVSSIPRTSGPPAAGVGSFSVPQIRF